MNQASANNVNAPDQDADPRIADAVAKALAERDATHARAMERERFIARKMTDVPAAYRGQLGEDPEKFEEMEQVIRKQFKADLEAAGIKAPNVGGNPGAVKITEAIDARQVTATQNISDGLAAARQERPAALPVAQAMKPQ